MKHPAKILVMGLPGSGKTTLATALDRALRGAGIRSSVLDGDAVRVVHRDPDFSLEGRIAQAERMGGMADVLTEIGMTAICSFICPTQDTRKAFWGTIGARGQKVRNMTVFVDRLISSAFPDTNRMFVPPNLLPDDHIVEPEDSVAASVQTILAKLGVKT